MPKFLYCMKCNYGFELDTEKVRTCRCGNLRGKYRPDGRMAEINAENPENAFFVGICCCKNLIYDEVLDKNPALIDEVEIEAESSGMSLREQVPPKDFDKKGFNRDEHMRKFLRNFISYISFCKPERLESEELRSAVKETKEWERYDWLKNKFMSIRSKEKWKEWEKGHSVHSMDEWEDLIQSDYCIGTVESLKKCNWHHRWVYCECLCFHD